MGGFGGSTGGLRPAAMQREVAELQDSWMSIADVLDDMRQPDHFCWIVSANNNGIAIHGDGFAGRASNLGERNFRDGDQ